MARSDPIVWPPRGMNRLEAARYVGVSPTKFDAMITDGLMPRPKRAGGRVIWDRFALDQAFADLPDQSVNLIDAQFGR